MCSRTGDLAAPGLTSSSDPIVPPPGTSPPILPRTRALAADPHVIIAVAPTVAASAPLATRLDETLVELVGDLAGDLGGRINVAVSQRSGALVAEIETARPGSLPRAMRRASFLGTLERTRSRLASVGGSVIVAEESFERLVVAVRLEEP